MSAPSFDVGPHDLHHGDCIAVMKSLAPDCIDACVTDPPYGLGFMGKAWDCAVPGPAFAAELFRVLKPGAHAVLFAATRTIHRTTCALEDAGFEVRDMIGWLQWQGFPKSLDVSKALDAAAGAERDVVRVLTRAATGRIEQGSGGFAFAETFAETAPATEAAKRWHGWGTALKPALEPAILVRKPLEGTVAANVLKWGTGALNIDAARYPYGDKAWPGPNDRATAAAKHASVVGLKGRRENVAYSQDNSDRTDGFSERGRWPANVYACPKASRSEREAGCEHLPRKTGAECVERAEGSAGLNSPRAGAGRTASSRGNDHPTVKPIALMRWLLKLVTPPGGVVLEPFCGSGTTLAAAHGLNLRIIAAELDEGHCRIAEARFRHASRQGLLDLEVA